MLRVLSMISLIVLTLTLLPLRAETAPSTPLPQPQQLVLAIAPSTETFTGTLRLFHRNESGKWIADAESWPVLFGKKGLAWGRGLHVEQPGLQKAERDGRSPAGRFRIGFALGNEPQLPAGSQGWSYHAKTLNDAWIEDPTLPNYNHLVTVPETNRPIWFDKQRLKLDDPAYHWLLVVEHNYPDSIPSAGSAIFFHVRRGEFLPTAGCTTMPRERLEQLLRWLTPSAKPQFVLLAQPDYERLWRSWQLPSPEQFSAK